MKKMKAVLVIDMPNRCWECPIHYLNICEANQYKVGWENGRNGKPDWCPLKPLPQKLPPNELGNMSLYKSGWNACLDAITGETE